MSKACVRTSFIEAGEYIPRQFNSPASFEEMVRVSESLGYVCADSYETETGRGWQGEKATDESLYVVTHSEVKK